ncbi:hypothetical protein H6504_04880 [Candidatus Woesearchaeota archaeon]|nr:hypothetical protein [Candidatus Woesearchaeota archaeon]
MGDEDLSISYETLFELLRREKYKDDIQKLPETFFDDVLTYISDKKTEIGDANQTIDLLKATEHAKLRNQLSNVAKILQELYDRREKKILMLAMNKARTDSNIIDTTNLLDIEKQLFHSLVRTMQNYRKGILISVLEGREASVTDAEVKVIVEKQEPKKVENKPEPSPSENALKKMVRFTHAVPKFVGKELEVYGPFQEEDVANLPGDIAELLIKKGRAVEISSQ